MMASGNALYQGISFEISYRISVLRLSLPQCEDGVVKRVAEFVFDCVLNG
jgi:hypothetical protein